MYKPSAQRSAQPVCSLAAPDGLASTRVYSRYSIWEIVQVGSGKSCRVRSEAVASTYTLECLCAARGLPAFMRVIGVVIGHAINTQLGALIPIQDMNTICPLVRVHSADWVFQIGPMTGDKPAIQPDLPRPGEVHRAIAACPFNLIHFTLRHHSVFPQLEMLHLGVYD